MSKHTPGPWHVDKRMLTAINNGPSDKPYKHIAMVNYYKSGDPITDVSIEEHIANAHLIAAAPEMLQALEKIAKDCEICEGYGTIEYQPSGIDGYLPTGDANFVTEDCPHCASILAIIAKAKGEQ